MYQLIIKGEDIMEAQILKNLFKEIYDEDVYFTFQSSNNELRIFILELLKKFNLEPKENEDFLFLNLTKDESDFLKINQILIFIEDDLYVIGKVEEEKGYQLEIIPNFEVESIKLQTKSKYHLEIDSMELKISGYTFEINETLINEHLLELVNRLKKL